jgi:EmrB/QacA subfamily drug resistance transporter
MSAPTLEALRSEDGLPVRQGRRDHPWWVLAVLAVAQLMVVLDATVVNIALPHAQSALGFGDAGRQWIVTSYALAFGSLLLLGGRLSDLIGRRTSLLIGVFGFAAASAIGGASNGFAMLVIARAAQGVFGALLAPAIIATLTTTFDDPAQRTRAFGVFGAVASSGAGVGLLLGGVLTQYLSWRWCLYVNVPVSVLAAFGILTFLSKDERDHEARLDLPGACVVTGALVAIVYGFSRAESHGWSDTITLVMFAIGAVGLAVFVVIERRVSHPLLPLHVVLDRARGGSYVTFAFAGIGMFGVFLFLTYYLEGSLGYSPVKTGFGFLPFIAGILVASNGPATRLQFRFGKRGVMTAGMTLAAIGLVLLTRIDVHSSYWSHVLPSMLMVGFGIGAVFPPGLDYATGGVSDDDAGVAGAMLNVTQQVGGAIGIAMLNTIAISAATHYIGGHAGQADAVARGNVHSYIVAFWWGAAIFALGALVTRLLLPRDSAPPAEGVTVVHH